MRSYGDVLLTYVANIDIAQTQDTGTGSHFGDLLCRILRLLDIASQNTGISAEMDEGPSLRAADGASTSCNEYDTVGYQRKKTNVSRSSIACLAALHGVCLPDIPKMPGAHAELRYSDLGTVIVGKNRRDVG